MSSDPLPALPFDLDPYGVAAMALGTRPKYKFSVVDGDRRVFHDRTPRPALDLKIIEGKNQP